VNPGCPRLVIAGTGSGVGKTSLALGLARALTRQGLRVQTFKVGPDFLDPTYLALASGRTCYNLDGWMTSRDYVRELFARATSDADVAIVEGVMGMFDGASPTTLEGSTAEIALWLAAPVLLVAHAHGVARSLAATVAGFAALEPAVRMAGVIANQSGSPRHRAWLSESLAAAGLAPLVGAMPRGAMPTIPSRHLGLVAAEHAALEPQWIEQLAHACQEHLDLEQIAGLARSAVRLRDCPDFRVNENGTVPFRARADRLGDCPNVRVNENGTVPFRLGIARDAAFHFYYPDNLQALENAGAELVPFSPLSDAALPGDLDGLYLGGGYPEIHAERLAANTAMLESVRRMAAMRRPIYAECGGLMYLGRSLRGPDGWQFPLAGVLPVDTAMCPSLRTLGYAEVTLAGDCLWGPAGSVHRGHEFHYSEILADDTSANGWRAAYTVRRRGDGEPFCAGFCRGRILASYVHLHWASRPEAARHFLNCCRERT